jgi:DNA polymerase III alpha subunit
MIQNKFGQIVLNEDDLVNYIMKGNDIDDLSEVLVDHSVNIDNIKNLLEEPPKFTVYTPSNITIPEFDLACQNNWYMPQEYKDLDIAKFVLDLCDTQEQLQRCGEELLLYQERNLFDLLRYMVYLVVTMKQNNIIWGVGRGSSVSSYILYLIGIHRIDSLYYCLDVRDFLR